MRHAFYLAALLLAAWPARAEEDCGRIGAALWRDRPEAAPIVRDAPRACAMAAALAPGQRWVAAIGEEDLFVALEHDGGAVARSYVAPLTIDPPWNPSVAVAVERILGPTVEAVRITYRNAYTSTGRSTTSAALHILLRRDAALVPVFASLVEARHNEEVACPPGRRPPCRKGWSRSWRVEAAPGGAGRMPDLVVRNAATGTVVSRHRWRSGRYEPPAFERLPAFGPG